MALAKAIRDVRARYRVLAEASLLAASIMLGQAPTAASAAGCNWPMYGHDPGHSFSQSPACAQINASNVAALTERWFFQTDDPITASTTVVNDVAYVGDWGGTMHAIDVATGTEVWNYQIDDLQNSYPG